MISLVAAGRMLLYPVTVSSDYGFSAMNIISYECLYLGYEYAQCVH